MEEVMSCIFCRIVKGEIPAEKIFENEKILAFKDINPMAKTHIIVIPKECHSNFHDIQDDLLTQIFEAIRIIIKEQGLIQEGYRLVNNTGKYAGQSIFHTHIHILGGEQLTHSFN